MLNGFLRMEDKFDALLGRVDHLTEEVREVKSDVRFIKTEAQNTNRRLSATFDQAGYLTEKVDDTVLRVSHVEQAQVPTNAELYQRIIALKNKLNQAS